MKDTSEAGDADDEGGPLGSVEPKPVEEAEDTAAGAQETAEGAAGDVEEEVEDTADDATEKAGDIDLAGKATQDPKGAVEDGAADLQETAGGTAEDAKDTADGAVDDAKDAAEDATGDIDIPGIEILKGLEVQEDGNVLDNEGNVIGRLVEGDAEDLAGYVIGDDGEILDDDGDLVGRTEVLPEKLEQMKDEAQRQAEDAAGNLPGVEILEGLTVDPTGLMYNEDGDTVGQLIEGNPADLQGLTANENGEFLDDEGNVIGRAKVHADAAGLYETAGDTAENGVDVDGVDEAVDGVGEQADGVADEAGEAVDGVEGATPELPGVEALEGMEVDSQGQIVDEAGNVLGEVAEGDMDQIKGVKGLTVNDQGEVVDADGNILGRVELAEGAAEKLAEVEGAATSFTPDLRILDGLKVNKKGKILDGDGEEIGELIDGDPAKCAGKKVNAKGEVIDNDGETVLGRVKVVPGDAANQAMKDLVDQLGLEAQPPNLPGLETLDGLKVNKKGKILDEDGEAIGELVDGELEQCAGKKVNDKGQVLDKDGKVIGRVKTLPKEVEEAAEEAEEAPEAVEEGEEGAEGVEEAVEEGVELPPLSILEGLTVNKAGKLIDAKGTVVGELVEGDAKKLSKSGITADSEGQFWDNKGHIIGRAQTVQIEEPEEEAPFAGLEGLIVNKDGYVEDENGIIVGQVVEGDAKKLVGRAVDEDGDIIDKKGSVVGHAERVEEAEEEVPEEQPIDLSSLAGRTLNKQGNVIGDEGVPIGRLVEGNPKELAGKKIDENGQIWNETGQVIGRVELIPEGEREAKPEGPFAGLEDLRVIQGGQVADEDGNVVGVIVEGNPKRLIGLSVDEDGDIIDKYGNVKGHAEPLEEEEEEPADLSILEGLTLNKQGFLVNADGIPVGRLVEGNLKDLAGRKSDGEGLIHSDTGKVVGRCELIPESERVTKPEGPFAGLEGLRVNKDGYVEDEDGNLVGIITEGNVKRLVGNAVDEDGDIIDKYGNVKGHADPWEPEEEAPPDLSILAGCTVNKAGNVVDGNGQILGRVAEGDPTQLIGKRVDGQGQIWDNAGNVVGRAELATGIDTKPEGPFSGFDNATVAKDGTIQTPAGVVIGRVIEGDIQKLVGHTVDEEGDIVDKNGNLIGKAERWEPEEKERRISPMAGRRVNKEGNVIDEDGNVIGKLTAGDLGHCVGFEIDDNGYVVDNDGNRIGEVTLLENIVEEEVEEETEEEKQKKQDAEIADKMAAICQQTLERIQPVCKQITDYIEAADRTPREELDEEELVNNVKPLIEEGGRILQECNGALRGLDPDGRIASQAKGRAGTREATPEEYRLADLLKELTSTVVTTIDNAKKRISDMPHAKKKLNPLWGLLTEPLFQIIAAVGLLLAGVLGLVGKLLNGLGLGGLVNGLLGGLGIDKLLSGLGLGSISEALGGGKKEKKKGGGASGLPLVGGMFGGK
ncbi:hypothetical protein NA57DRAFT_38592 [Rhizodiscina lignyota]|uniref:DUF6987 domain-containing protein n=1 Tax=Rhizodiscina lignyota TaxID=1504668 RepID=A0A9P4IG48_9PEZI|nr:hypothetical protein NA57DRAFT_38592 [Rhizodiscina lignyota]